MKYRACRNVAALMSIAGLCAATIVGAGPAPLASATPNEADLHVSTWITPAANTERDHIIAGEQVVFELTIGNDGPSPAKGVVAQAELPNGFHNVTLHGDYSGRFRCQLLASPIIGESGKVMCDAQKLDPTKNATDGDVTVLVSAVANKSLRGQVKFFASVNSSTDDPFSINNNRGSAFNVVTAKDGGVDRAGGKNRYGTGVAFAEANFPFGAHIVFLASGQTYPDALAAAAIAGASTQPVLLTPQNGLSPEVRKELQRLKPSEVVLVGGTGALSNAVEQQTRKALPDSVVSRVSGANRFDTAATLARQYIRHANPELYLASGMDFPDALSAAAAAGARNAAVLLTQPNELSAETRSALQAMRPKRVIVVGGKGVISDEVANQARTAAGNAQLVRHGGKDRFITAKIVADNTFKPQVERIVVANAFDYPDALVGAAVAGMNHSPVLLTSATTLAGPTKGALSHLKPRIVTIAGGQAVVSEQVRKQVANASGLRLK